MIGIRGMGYVCQFVNNNLFNQDSDSEREECYDDKIYNFYEIAIMVMLDKQFKMHFRIDPDSFESLFRMMQSVYDPVLKAGRPSVLLEKQILIMLWYLANLECFRSVANRFGVTKSTCWDILYRCCHLLLKVNIKFNIISWPTGERAVETITKFRNRHKLNGVIGAIDGSHIRIKTPLVNHSSFINRQSYHSILLQGVCDSDLLFTDVYAGEAGSIHDLTLFRRSDLYQRIQNGEVSFPNDSFLIGDLVYQLSTTLLVGFKTYTHLSNMQKNFNVTLNRTRAVIENAFGLLKGRFRRLKSLETVRLDLISLLIIAASILHNICIYSNDRLVDLLDLNAEVLKERRNNPRNIEDIDIENTDIGEGRNQKNELGKFTALNCLKRQLKLFGFLYYTIYNAQYQHNCCVVPHLYSISTILCECI